MDGYVCDQRAALAGHVEAQLSPAAALLGLAMWRTAMRRLCGGPLCAAARRQGSSSLRRCVATRGNGETKQPTKRQKGMIYGL